MIPDLQSSAAATEFKECLYQNQVTVHCQAHDRCLDCEGCEECKKSGLSASPVEGAQCETCGSAATAVGAERGHNPVVAQAPSAEGRVSGIPTAVTEDLLSPTADPSIPTFDEEYGVHYRGRIHSGMVNA